MIKLPKGGIIGSIALREAAAGEMRSELRALIERIRAALEAKINAPLPQEQRGYLDLEAVFADRVIVCRDGRYWSYPYTQGKDSAITLGDATEVVEDYKPVTAAEAQSAHALAGAVFIEAAATPGKYSVRVIRAGLSGNNNYYPDAVLKAGVDKFNGARVFIKGDVEHLTGGGKHLGNLVGRIAEAKFVAGAAPDTGEVLATMQFIDAADPVAIKVREAVAKDMQDLFGLSIVATFEAKRTVMDGKKVNVAQKLLKVKSVDLIVEPGAGGAVVRMVEAAEDFSTQEEQHMFKTQLFEALAKKHAAKVAGKTIDDFTEAELIEALAEDAGAAGGDAAAANAQTIAEAVGAATKGLVTLDQLQLRESLSAARERLAESNLPAAAKARVKQLIDAQTVVLTEAKVDELIKAEREYLGQVTNSGRVSMAGLGIEVTESQGMKFAERLDAFFDPKHKNHRYCRSFREAYIDATGDAQVTGELRHCNRSRMAEALGDALDLREALDSTSFAYVLGNSITRRMLAEYQNVIDKDAWRKIANVVPVGDFRTNERTRFGEYQNLPTVVENEAYPDLASPTDERATYAIAKRGGTERVTREMIMNDDVGAIQRIPGRVVRAAKTTLATFVFDFLRTNPVIYDGLTLFHATHGNLGAAALDATSMAARRLAMMKQAALSSGNRLGIPPAMLVVPLDLQESAVNLFNRNTNLDKTFVNSMSLEIIPVWYWTDTNDWVLSASPMDIPGLEIGFLNGQEEPQMFVQDMNNVGSMFTNDQMTWKVRFEFGGNITDWRQLDKSVV